MGWWWWLLLLNYYFDDDVQMTTDPLLGCAFSTPAIIQYVKLRYGIAVHGVTDQHRQKCVFTFFDQQTWGFTKKHMDRNDVVDSSGRWFEKPLWFCSTAFGIVRMIHIFTDIATAGCWIFDHIQLQSISFNQICFNSSIISQVVRWNRGTPVVFCRPGRLFHQEIFKVTQQVQQLWVKGPNDDSLRLCAMRMSKEMGYVMIRVCICPNISKIMYDKQEIHW